MTQAFFARPLEKRWLREADPERGRFGTFLLTAMMHFLAKDWRQAQTIKRLLDEIAQTLAEGQDPELELRELLSKQVQQFEAQMRNMRDQVNAFQRRQSAQATQVTSWGNILTGITPTTDPLNGTTRDVWTGPKSGYWINGLGEVRNSTDSPGPGWRPLQVQQ